MASGSYKANAFFSLLLAMLILFSGCVNIDTHEQFYPNGRSRVVTQIYTKNLISTLNRSGFPLPQNYTSSDWETYFNDECNSLSSRAPGEYCHMSQGWAIIDKGRVSGDGYALNSYEAFPYTIYELSIFEVPVPHMEGFGSVGNFRVPKTIDFSIANRTYLSQIKAAGIKYDYTISVPGEILEYNAGVQADGNIKVDAIRWSSRAEAIKVKSRELNLQQIALIAISAILIFLFVDFVLLWIYHEWSRRRRSARKRKILEEAKKARKRVFRKDERLKGSEVYKAPGFFD
ncbi:hypothetical protein COU37_00430 [Candidatus Micrarchaeota archaeon CG10_big_fil_rev_8_21_14_0_10_45_29]|nr:MAG: hypothetical protein COU37_00430 [Candidatus Micrarchaeota archaeon CG10_big_fil_rev_8_21_14_0_10_45_29]